MTHLRTTLALVMTLSLVACEDGLFVVHVGDDLLRDLRGSYYAGAVELSWRLGPGWSRESFRVYGKRVRDDDYYWIAEVTSCAEGRCEYRDSNVRPGVTYEYFVVGVDAESGNEGDFEHSVEVYVPRPIPPAVPFGVGAVGLDNAVYLFWDDSPAAEEDFSFYRVYYVDTDDVFLLGETDSPGFVDFLASNGVTTTYLVTSVDDQGHESDYSEEVSGTPRPDYTEEFIFAHQDLPSQSGFRFQEAEDLKAVMSGADPDRHLRLDADRLGLWLTPGPEAQVYPQGKVTTALKCGPGADADCISWELAPTSGYTRRPVEVLPGVTYIFRVPGDDGELRYGAVRVTRSGLDQDGHELIVFDWAYQTQAGNPSLNTSETVGF